VSDDWAVTPLGNVVALASGDLIKADDYKDPSGEVIVVGAGGRLGQTRRPANTSAPAVVIGRVGAAGAAHYFDSAVFATDNTLVATPDRTLNPRFLYHFIRSVDWSRLQSGSSQPLINQRIVKALEIPLPSVDEQRGLARLLDSVDAVIASAATHVSNSRRAIERFRQAVLAAACSGRLTVGWRQGTEFDGVDNEDPLPDGWQIRPGIEVFTFVTSGSRGWARYYASAGPAFIRVGNLDHDSLDLDLATIQRVAPPDNAEARRTLVEPGDLLISITAEIGMVGVVPRDLGPAHVNQHVAIARPDRRFNSRYLACFVAARTGGQAQLETLQRGATKAGLGLQDLRALSIPIPPRAEQDEIVRRVDHLFEVVDALHSRIDVASRGIDLSSQAVLAKAFRGDLGGISKSDDARL
jgi:type I restriction enzyme, S subunit